MRGNSARIFWLVATATFVLDQVSKSLVRVLWGEPAARIPWDAIVAGRSVLPSDRSSRSRFWDAC